jgi:hypothetical protein
VGAVTRAGGRMTDDSTPGGVRGRGHEAPAVKIFSSYKSLPTISLGREHFQLQGDGHEHIFV